MKTFLILSLLALSPLARAEDAPQTGPTVPACSNNNMDISANPAAILAAIKGSQFCWQAVQLADNCAGGDEDDFNNVAAAAPVCAKEFEANNPTSQDRILLASMRTSCDGKWKDKVGGQYLANNSMCKLHAWLWMDKLTAENGAKQ
jgi:hypothetical protein